MKITSISQIYRLIYLRVLCRRLQNIIAIFSTCIHAKAKIKHYATSVLVRTDTLEQFVKVTGVRGACRL